MLKNTETLKGFPDFGLLEDKDMIEFPRVLEKHAPSIAFTLKIRLTEKYIRIRSLVHIT